MWLIGGTDSSGRTKDVYITTDGTHWTRKASGLSFLNVDGFAAAYFNGALWVLGGSGTSITNQIYKSADDGATWTQITPSAGDNFTPRLDFTALSFDNSLWVIGGITDTSGHRTNSTYRSLDGTSWILMPASLATGGIYTAVSSHASVVYDNRMWVLGGIGNSGSTSEEDDVWYSTDGWNWAETTSAAAFGGRYDHSSVAYQNKIWVIGGVLTSGTLKNDVWSSN
jgi:hypothetical protein